MKDAFMPIVLTVIVIIAAVFFITKVFAPQKQTVNALVNSSEQSQTSLVSVADANGEEVTGVMVKALYTQYNGKDGVTVSIVEDDGDSITIASVKDEDTFIKSVTRADKDRKLTNIKFVKK